MKIKSIALGIVAILIIAGGLVAVQAGNDEPGNGAPSGKHYTLNILGKDWNNELDLADTIENLIIRENNGHRIFVKLTGKTRIMLTESSVDEFNVIDCDGTDGKAVFELPKPYDVDVDNVDPATARYKVYIRVLSPDKNGEQAWIGTTVALDGMNWLPAGEIEWYHLEGKNGKPRFKDVTSYLTTVYIDWDGDTVKERIGLFDSRFQDALWAWDYQNEGLKHVQIRFYPDVEYW